MRNVSSQSTRAWPRRRADGKTDPALPPMVRADLERVEQAMRALQPTLRHRCRTMEVEFVASHPGRHARSRGEVATLPLEAVGAWRALNTVSASPNHHAAQLRPSSAPGNFATASVSSNAVRALRPIGLREVSPPGLKPLHSGLRKWRGHNTPSVAPPNRRGHPVRTPPTVTRVVDDQRRCNGPPGISSLTGHSSPAGVQDQRSRATGKWGWQRQGKQGHRRPLSPQ